MDAQIMRKIDNQLQQKRANAIFKANKQKEELLSSDPELNRLERTKRSIACDLTIEKSKKKQMLYKANAEIEKYLSVNKIKMPAPQFDCKTCSDTGFTEKDGKQERCSCFTRMLVEESMQNSDIAALHTFEDFNENIFSTEQKTQMLEIKNYCLQFSENFPNVKKSNIVLCGGTGTGKTFLLSCIASKLKKRGFSVAFITAGKMFDILRKYAFNKISDIDFLINADMLIIDDMGTEPIFNNITLEYTFMLINERAMLNKPMCISTNLLPDELKSRYTERISSRIFDQTTTNVLQLSGSDLRLRKC